MPSTYALLRNALDVVLDERAAQIDPTPYGGYEGLFTELDLIQYAADSSWSKADYREAESRDASNILGQAFKSGRVVRYGPVTVPGHNADYLRFASKVVYAPLDGPSAVRTPNGIFDRVFYPTLVSTGRKSGANRNDFILWEHQDDLVEGQVVEIESPPRDMRREISRLGAELRIAQEKLQRALQENERLRQRSAERRYTSTEVQRLVAAALSQLETAA